MRSVTARVLAGALAMAAALAATASAEPKRDNGRFAWLVGCWRSADGQNEEVWSAPLGGVMFGHAVTIKDGVLAFYEQERIDLRPPRATYTVSPNGSRFVVFVEPPAKPPELDKRGKALPPPEIAMFENGDNDFPQRIQYAPGGKNNKGLTAAISKLDGSGAVNYAWDRCKD